MIASKSLNFVGKSCLEIHALDTLVILKSFNKILRIIAKNVLY